MSPTQSTPPTTTTARPAGVADHRRGHGADHEECIRQVRVHRGPAWHIACYDLIRELLTDRRLGDCHPDPDRAALVAGSPLSGAMPFSREASEVINRRKRKLLSHEERRAADSGAVAVEVVDRISVAEHGLSECVNRVTGSPAATRRVLKALAELARGGALTSDPKWASTVAAARVLKDAIDPPPNVPRRRW